MHNRACCWVSGNCQSKLSVHSRPDEYVNPILHVPRHAPFPDGILFPNWWYNPILHRAEPRGGNGKYKKGIREE